MPCCKYNGSGARCRGCSCAKGKKGCIHCYPGRKGMCVNSPISPQASSQQPSCSSDHACVSNFVTSFPVYYVQSMHCSSPDPPQPPSSPLRSHACLPPQPAVVPAHIPPLSPPTSSNIGFDYDIGSLHPGFLRTNPQLLQIYSCCCCCCCCLNHSCLMQAQLPCTQSHHLQLSQETPNQSHAIRFSAGTRYCNRESLVWSRDVWS